MPRLEHWSLINADGTPADHLDPAAAQRLRGHVYGHPQHTDGKPVRTSTIAAAAGRSVKTDSGQVYELGQVDAAYLAWLGDRALPLAPALKLVAPHELDGVRVRP